jgi:hypothetical protein
MPRKPSKLSVVRVTAAERAAQALDLRKAGMTFRQIGEHMGVTEGRAHQIVTRELARLNAKRQEAAEAVTRLELERLDSLLAAVWGKAEKGDLAAVDRVLSILARRAKLLGLDAEKAGAGTVQNVNVNVETMTDADRAAAIAAILARVGQASSGQDLDGEAGQARPLLGAPATDPNGCWDAAGSVASEPAPLFQ